jgi:hypothetical protein
MALANSVPVTSARRDEQSSAGPACQRSYRRRQVRANGPYRRAGRQKTEANIQATIGATALFLADRTALRMLRTQSNLTTTLFPTTRD